MQSVACHTEMLSVCRRASVHTTSCGWRGPMPSSLECVPRGQQRLQLKRQPRPSRLLVEPVVPSDLVITACMSLACCKQAIDRLMHHYRNCPEHVQHIWAAMVCRECTILPCKLNTRAKLPTRPEGHVLVVRFDMVSYREHS